jgi:L-lysine exporter family protein LysE/ArgO
MLAAFLHGLVLAFGLIIPLGPQNVFVFTQGATHARYRDVVPVVAAAGVADSILILLGVLGVSAAVIAVPALKLALVALGVCFLLYAGWASWRALPAEDGEIAEPLSLRRRVMLGLAFSLLNPHAILDTVGVLGPSALVYEGAARTAFAAATLGVSWLWFAGLALAGRVLESMTGLRRVLGRVSAVAMWASAAYLAWMAVAGPLAAR